MRRRLTTSRSDTVCSQKRHDVPTALSRLICLASQYLISGAYIELEKRLQSKRAFTGAWPYGA